VAPPNRATSSSSPPPPLRAFIEALHGGDFRLTGAEAVFNFSVLQAVYEVARTGRAVTLARGDFDCSAGNNA